MLLGAPGASRSLVAICPYWALIAAGRGPAAEVVVVHANRVVVASPAARAAGVREGMRRREAEGTCPEVDVVQRDLAGEARAWELAVAAVEAFAPGVEVLAPGQLAFTSRGPSRYFGGDEALALRVAGAVSASAARLGGAAGEAATAWGGCCQVGVADGLFAAGIAARLAPQGGSLVIPPGGTAQFLAPLQLSSLAHALPGDLGWAAGAGNAGLAAQIDLLGRLGLRTLGDFAELPAHVVLSRFGVLGSQAHRLARGLGERHVRARQSPPEWVVSAELDPPADQLQAAVFVGRALAEQLHEHLLGQGLVCTRLAIEVETEHGATFRRSWRHEGALSAAAIAERVRWQLEGWAQPDPGVGGSPESPGVEAVQGGRLIRLALVPEEVVPDTGRQLGFWGGDAGAAARAARAMARVQGLLGPSSVLTAFLGGGRGYADQVVFVPWGEPRPTVALPEGLPPWPGKLPGVAPAVVHRRPQPAQVLDGDGKPVEVGGRGLVSSSPVWVVAGNRRRSEVEAWAGPWPLEERWWDAGGRRRARLQVLTADGRCYLLAREKYRWWVEATYD